MAMTRTQMHTFPSAENIIAHIKQHRLTSTEKKPELYKSDPINIININLINEVSEIFAKTKKTEEEIGNITGEIILKRLGITCFNEIESSVRVEVCNVFLRLVGALHDIDRVNTAPPEVNLSFPSKRIILDYLQEHPLTKNLYFRNNDFCGIIAGLLAGKNRDLNDITAIFITYNDEFKRRLQIRDNQECVLQVTAPLLGALIDCGKGKEIEGFQKH